MGKRSKNPQLPTLLHYRNALAFESDHFNLRWLQFPRNVSTDIGDQYAHTRSHYLPEQEKISRSPDFPVTEMLQTTFCARGRVCHCNNTGSCHHRFSSFPRSLHHNSVTRSLKWNFQGCFIPVLSASCIYSEYIIQSVRNPLFQSSDGAHSFRAHC